MKQEKFAVTVAVVTATTTVVLSMVLNSWAFTQQRNSVFGHSVGVLLPLWVLALTYMGHYLWPVERKLGIAAYALAGFALVVSMPHLAAGYELLGLHWWECWSLAIVTDTAQVLAKLLVITVADRSKTEQRQAKKAAKPAAKRGRKRPALAFGQGRVRPAQVVRQSFQSRNLVQNPLEKRWSVAFPVCHAVFFFVRLMFQSFRSGVSPHLSGG